MQRNFISRYRQPRLLRWGMLFLAVLAMTACGPLGDEDDDPTATTESISQPTSSVTEEVTGTQEDGGLISDGIAATPAGDASTPVSTGPGSDRATPDQPFTVIVGTPAVPATAGDSPAVTTEASDEPDSVFQGSDGTSGATPPTSGSDAVGEATPADPGSGLVVADEATPGVDASPETIALADLDPVAVSSCEPETVPAFEGAQSEFITTADVNFRTGPGADCDTIGEGPIGSNFPVTVLSGPVTREGDDQFTWVQVQILDQTGWVVLEVLEPAA